MSIEEIIRQINEDSEKEVKRIIEEAKSRAKEIIEDSKKEAKTNAERIILEGKRKGENLKRAMIAKANQEKKKEILKIKDEIIEKCFLEAHRKLGDLKGKEYHKMIKEMIKEGQKRLGKDCKVSLTREEDKKIVEKIGLNIVGKIDASGGVILRSIDNRITVDYTFESILKRNKDKLRIEISKILFS